MREVLACEVCGWPIPEQKAINARERGVRAKYCSDRCRHKGRQRRIVGRRRYAAQTIVPAKDDPHFTPQSLQAALDKARLTLHAASVRAGCSYTTLRLFMLGKTTRLSALVGRRLAAALASKGEPDDSHPQQTPPQ